MGFTLNPYDKCMSNKMINGKQCTIAWHVDDNKISHVNVDVVKEVMEVLQKFFGKFTVTRGRSHSYLDMNIELREDRNISVDTIEEIEKIIEDFSESIDGKVTSLAKKDMHNTTGNCKILEGKLHNKIHLVTQKLLYISKGARLDIDTLIALLCTRVWKSTEYD